MDIELIEGEDSKMILIQNDMDMEMEQPITIPGTTVQVLICPSSCLDCINNVTCTVCLPGFFVNSTGNCSTCPLNCNTCFSSSVCSLCSVGYYVASGHCYACGANCR